MCIGASLFSVAVIRFPPFWVWVSFLGFWVCAFLFTAFKSSSSSPHTSELGIGTSRAASYPIHIHLLIVLTKINITSFGHGKSQSYGVELPGYACVAKNFPVCEELSYSKK